MVKVIKTVIPAERTEEEKRRDSPGQFLPAGEGTAAVLPVLTG